VEHKEMEKGGGGEGENDDDNSKKNMFIETTVSTNS
jgi:hypothetical protein